MTRELGVGGGLEGRFVLSVWQVTPAGGKAVEIEWPKQGEVSISKDGTLWFPPPQAMQVLVDVTASHWIPHGDLSCTILHAAPQTEHWLLSNALSQG